MASQREQTASSKLEIKLDKIANMLDLVIDRMDEEEPDSKMMKRIQKEWKEIESGYVKIHHYNSLADFESSLNKKLKANKKVKLTV